MKIKITVRNRDKPENTSYSFRFGDRCNFVLLRTECDSYLNSHDWQRPFMDLSRIIVLQSGFIDVIQTERIYDVQGGLDSLDAKGVTVAVDVRKLLRRAIEVGAKMKPNKWDDIIFEFDDRRFQPQVRTLQHKTVMQLVNSFAAGFDREHFIKSLLSFRTLTKENWGRLMRTLSDYSSGKLYGGGRGEINFRSFGMYGGIICRDTDFSIHT